MLLRRLVHRRVRLSQYTCDHLGGVVQGIALLVLLLVSLILLVALFSDGGGSML